MHTSQLLVWGATTIVNFFKSGGTVLTAFQPINLRWSLNK